MHCLGRGIEYGHLILCAMVLDIFFAAAWEDGVGFRSRMRDSREEGDVLRFVGEVSVGGVGVGMGIVYFHGLRE